MRKAGVVDQNKYKGVRRRKWGKWVSEIRVPVTQERLWLGSYSMPEAAAVAHDVAFYCLRRPASLDCLNFPMVVHVESLSQDMSPRSVQRVASDAGMGVDAQMIASMSPENYEKNVEEIGGLYGDCWTWEEEKELSISVEDYLIM